MNPTTRDNPAHVLIAALVASVLLIVGWVALTPSGRNVPTNWEPPTCFEDEAVMRDGDEHTICMPIDDIVADR